jgi:4-hydroxy-3-methylbut-2-enyl diphosphate reductase
MKCFILKESGFCLGVKNAVDAAYDHADGNTYMYGEVVHNPAVIRELAEKGLPLINSLDEIVGKKKATVLIRAHGAAAAEITDINDRGFSVLDKTCPKVKKIHEIVTAASEKGMKIVVVGRPKHPEVEGIVGWASGDALVVKDLNDAQIKIKREEIPAAGICVVSQTTYSREKYHEIYEYLEKETRVAEFHDTICSVTAKRQEEARELAKRVECFIVVGGKNSSNVTKLFETAAEYCSTAQHIETAEELDFSAWQGIGTVAVVGGTSTPEKSVYNVVKKIKDYSKQRSLPFELIKI